MNSTNLSENYFIDGCGRCKLYKTPHCKVHSWTNELKTARKILISIGLKEELKWSVPCYTHDGKNIVLLAAFKDCIEISFFKGALLKDPKGYLIARGENSQHGKGLRFTDAKEITKFKKIIVEYVAEAVSNEIAGLKIQSKGIPEPMPKELEEYLTQDNELSKAYHALTPGKQRSYIIYIGSAKHSETRIKRIQQCIAKIMKGEGFHDTYKKNK